MDLEFGSIFKLLQQFRRINWGGALQTLTQGEYMGLCAIAQAHSKAPDRPGVYVSSLAEDLMISVSMVSKLLKTLEEKGWILRTIDPSSRRNTFVALTEEGQSLLSAERGRVHRVNQQVIDLMGEEDFHRLLQDAQRLSDCYAQVLGAQ